MSKDSKIQENSDDKDQDNAANGNLTGNVPTPANNQPTPTKSKQDKEGHEE